MFARSALVLLGLAAVATASSVTCTLDTTVGKCTGTCTATPSAPVKGANFTITATGNCAEDVTTATYDVQGTFAGIPVLHVKGNDACSATDFPVGGALNLGHMYINGAQCPVAQGTALSIVSQAFVSKLAPPGTLKASLTAYDQAASALLKIDFSITM